MSYVLGIARAAYTRYETGINNPPKDKIIKLAKFFGVSTDYLLGLTDIRTPIKELSHDQKLNLILSNKELIKVFEDYDSWSIEDKKELETYLKAKKISRKNKEK